MYNYILLRFQTRVKGNVWLKAVFIKVISGAVTNRNLYLYKSTASVELNWGQHVSYKSKITGIQSKDMKITSYCIWSSANVECGPLGIGDYGYQRFLISKWRCEHQAN